MKHNFIADENKVSEGRELKTCFSQCGMIRSHFLPVNCARSAEPAFVFKKSHETDVRGVLDALFVVLNLLD